MRAPQRPTGFLAIGSSVIWIIVLVTCILGLVSTSVLGLSVPGQVVLPLAMGLEALFTSIAASWAGNFRLADDGSRSRLLSVVGVAEAAAAVVSGVLLLLFVLDPPPLAALRLSLLPILLVSAGVIALSATVAVRRLRTPQGNLVRDIGISLGLVVPGPVAVFGTVMLLCSTVIRCVP